MLRCEATIHPTSLQITYALTNTVGEAIYVFDQIPFGRSGPQGFEAGVDSSRAWTAVQSDGSLLVLQGNVSPPPSPPCPPFERVFCLATEVKDGQAIERTVELQLPLVERSPYVGPEYADGRPGTREPLDTSEIFGFRFAVQFLREQHARLRRHPTHDAAWEAIGYPVEREQTSIDLASAVTVQHFLQPIERFG
jgi:hypothetical protein